MCKGLFHGPMNSATCPPCKKEQRRIKQQQYRKFRHESVPVKVEKKRLCTDKQQMQINKQIDSKYDTPLAEKIYKPNTAEFQQIADELMSRRSKSNVDSKQYEGIRFLPTAIRQTVAG